MKKFNALKGDGLIYIVGETLLYNIAIMALIFLVNSYELSNILKLTFLVVNLYQFYYIFMYTSLYYSVNDSFICINSIFKFKNERIPFEDIKCYVRKSGAIKGIRLCGYGKDHFALGKSIIDKVGIVKMFSTSSKKDIIYFETDDMSFGISPEDVEGFENILKEKNIPIMQCHQTKSKTVNLYKDKRFFIPFILVTIAIVILTLNPFILYLRNMLPDKIPLSFDARFNPIKFGTGKQFAFKQMVYGALNMAILFCMHYVSYFYAKYDKKIAYKYIYISLASALLFLVMQIQILMKF